MQNQHARINLYLASKIFFLLVISISNALPAKTQNRKMKIATTAGYLINHDRLGSNYQGFTPGGHIGFNMYSKKAERIKTDFQVSLNFSGGQNALSSFQSVNALYGGRFYLTNPEKPTKLFANALIGATFVRESGYEFIEYFLRVGYTVGCVLEINRFILGPSIESYNSIIFKLGYGF